MRDRRLTRLDFRDKVEGVWEDRIPIVRQWILEGVGVHESLLNSEEALEAAARAFCDTLGVTILDTLVHKFEPMGFTVVLLLSESHVAIHTWPERRYVHVDMVTCKKTKLDIAVMADMFDRQFSPSHCRAFSVKY